MSAPREKAYPTGPASWRAWYMEETYVQVVVVDRPTGAWIHEAITDMRERMQPHYPECKIVGMSADVNPANVVEGYRGYKLYRVRFRIYSPPLTKE